MRRSTMRRGPASKVRGLILMVVGVGAIIWGVYSIGRTTASCGGQTMHAGDTCVETTNGVQDGAPRSISQQLADEHEDGWGGVGGGVLLLVVGGIVVVGKRGKRAVPYGGPGQAAFPVPAGPPPAGGVAPGQPLSGWSSGPGSAQPANPGGYGQQQAWGQPQYPQQQGWSQPQYPQQGHYPQS